MKYKLNTLYNEDCMQALKEIPDNYFDLAIVDPPYGIGYSQSAHKNSGQQYGKALAKKADYDFKDWDSSSPDKEYFEELRRVSKNQIIWGANHFISNMPYDSSCWIVWDKVNGTNHFADCELAWTSFDTAVRKFEFMWNGMLQGNMKDKEIRFHPTQKPVQLYAWLLNRYAKKGDKILDTHVGSASSLVACYRLGFDYIGFEIDKDYFEKAQKRLEVEQSQMRLEF